jgi:hypothetical protein
VARFFQREDAEVAQVPFFFPARPHDATALRTRSRLKIFALVCAANLGLLTVVALGWSALPLLPIVIGTICIGGLVGLAWEEVAAKVDALPGDDDHPNVG